MQYMRRTDPYKPASPNEVPVQLMSSNDDDDVDGLRGHQGLSQQQTLRMHISNLTRSMSLNTFHTHH